VLVVAVMVMVMAFAAFTVDIGFITVTKAELQKTADGSALSAMIDLKEGLGPSSQLSNSTVEANARQTVVDVAAANRAGGKESVTADPNNGVRFGQVVYDSSTGSWVKTWGVAPYNMVEVTVNRSDSGEVGDGPLPLSFAPVIGQTTANVEAKAIAAVLPAIGFRMNPGAPNNPEILPIALDEYTWNDMLAGGGSDDYSWNEANKTVSNGSDGIREVNLYPYGPQELPPGNRGTVDFGSSSNSTADLKRQILYGLNENDLSYFGGEITFENGPLTLNGDTGLSAGIKTQLTEIIGQPRAIPIFTEVSGPGNNAMFTVVRLVGIRILDVRLSGKNKYVIVQPAIVSSAHAIPGGETISTGSVVTKPMLIK